MVQVDLISGDEKFTFDNWFWGGATIGAVGHVMACKMSHVNPIRSIKKKKKKI